MPEMQWKSHGDTRYTATYHVKDHLFHCLVSRSNNNWAIWEQSDDGIMHLKKSDSGCESPTTARVDCEQALDVVLREIVVPDILVVCEDGYPTKVLTRMPDMVAMVGKEGDYREGAFPFVAYEW